MSALKVCCYKPIPLKMGYVKDVAFNGCEYIFLDPKNYKMLKYDSCLCFVEEIGIKRRYTCICFDCDEDCYWAIANFDASVIYQLDRCFQEIGQMNIKNAGKHYANGICCDCNGKNIWVSFLHCVGKLKKDCGLFTFFDNTCRQTNKSILCLPPCRLLAYIENEREYIDVLRTKCSDMVTLCIPRGYEVEGMCFCMESSCETTIYSVTVLMTQAGKRSPFVMRCCVQCCCAETDDCEIEFSMDAKQSGCDCESCCCGETDCCNTDYCNMNCCNAKSEIMHSIALEEAALSHILNAEGEKIQKAVAECKNTEELLKVNESVQHTISRVTQLEMQLFLKLEALMYDCKTGVKCDCAGELLCREENAHHTDEKR